MEIRDRIARLREQIRHHDRLYYIEASPQISDRQYDRLLDELRQLEQQHPQLVTADSPTQRIGDAPVEHLRQVAHAVPMLSIDNTYSQQQLAAYFRRIEKALDGQPVHWVMDFKIDGVAASVLYVDGRLHQGITRGNGQVGDDITHNVRTIRDLPLTLGGEDLPELLEVRGEVYMTEADLADLNVRQVEAGLEPYKNTRNVTAGTIRLLDSRITASRKLRFFAHGVGRTDGLEVATHMEFLQRLQRFGIPVTPGTRRLDSGAEALQAVAELERSLPELPFEIDGIVFKIDSLQQRAQLGIRSKSPRWLIAYKFERYEATTRLRRIDVQVGKTGAITPVAYLDPVDIADTTVSRASLHNADEIERLDVRIGDQVVVEKAGKIIPKVIRAEKHLRSGPLEKYEFPDQCPSCGGALARDPGGVYIRCPNPSCPAQLRQRLIYFASRPGMDIDGLGDKIIDQLVDRGLVRSVADLYRLSEHQLIEQVDLVKRRKAEKLVQAIQRSKSRGLACVLASLSIRHVGPRVAKLLAERYRSLEALAAATPQALASIHEIGERIAQSVHRFLHSDSGARLLKQLAEVGVSLEQPAGDVAGSQATAEQRPLQGQRIVVTGTLQHYKRDQIRDLIERLGGRASDSVSKNTDFVVAGENAGSKLSKAEQLGVPVLSEAEFTQRIRCGDPRSV